MNIINKHITLFGCILLVCILCMSSCIKEDMSDCPIERYLHFETINKDYKFQDIVEKVDLYIYDGEELIETKLYTREDLKAWDFKVPLYDRSDGAKLHYVALVNQEEGYIHTINEQNKRSLLTEVVTSQGDSVTNRLPDVFHGTKDILFSNYLSDIADTIYLKKNTNNINLHVGFQNYTLPEGSVLRSTLQGSNGKYDAENKPVETTYYTYIPYKWNAGDGIYNYNFHFTTMRLWIGSDTNITLQKYNSGSEKGENLQSLNIVNELMKVVVDGKYLYNTNEKLDMKNDFDIVMFLDDNFVIMELVINDWAVISGGVPL